MEEVQGSTSVVSDVGSSSPNVSNNSNVASGSDTQATGRMFNQSEVNEIVKKVKYGAVEDYKRINQQQPEYAQQKYGVNNNNQQNATNTNLETNNEDFFRRIVSDEIQRSRNNWMTEERNRLEVETANKIVEEFKNISTTGKDRYADFDQVAGTIDYSKYPYIVQMLTQNKDTAVDMMYHFAKNRGSLVTIEQAMSGDRQQDGMYIYNDIARSIKDNQSAAKIRTPNEPLSQMRPSNTGTGTNGALSVRDLRSRYKV